MNYNTIRRLALVASCVSISQSQWDEYMKGAVRADKRKVNALVKKMLPDLYDQLALNAYNPYDYFRTDKHLILVHSGIEYFIVYT